MNRLTVFAAVIACYLLGLGSLVSGASIAAPNPSHSRLLGQQMTCVGGKLDPICIGYRFSMAHAKYGVPASWETVKKGPHNSALDGIVGWYIGGHACRFYYVTEESRQCLTGATPCPIIKEIACE